MVVELQWLFVVESSVLYWGVVHQPRRRLTRVALISLHFSFIMSGDWNHGICGCFDDCGTCIVTYFIPCYTHGKNAEAVGESCLLCGLSLMVPLLDLFTMTSIRSKVREQHGIAGSMVGDLLLSLCCPLCSLVQVAQQVKGSPGSHSIARC